jgi:hypothetical protein
MSGGTGKYSFDTSALIDGIERFYPPANFPGVWEAIDDLIIAGRILISDEVWREATAADAALRDWCMEPGSHRTSAVCPTHKAVAAAAGAIVQRFLTWVTQGLKNGADPFVIAVAEIHGCTVVSGETNGGPGRPKIPYVCRQLSVPHIRFTDVIIREGWVLRR